MAKISWDGRITIFLFMAGFVAIFFPGLAHAQTGNVVFSQSTYTVNVSQSNATITVLFSGSVDPVTVDYITSDGSAVSGVDYVGVSNTLFFTAGALTNTFSIALLNNPSAAPTQTVNLALLNPIDSTNPFNNPVLGNPSTAVLEIINNQFQELQFSQTSYSVDDTDTVATITIVRVGATNGTATVDFSTSDGSAKAGIDYTMTTGTVTFADGVLTNTVMIPIISPAPDALETNQTVRLTLTNPTGGATLGSPVTAQLTIVATGPPVIELSATTYNVHEHVGHAVITAIRFGDSSVAASVDYATSDGTASNGIDYFSTSGTLVFPSGISQSAFSFSFQEFKTFQSNKTVNVTISNPGGGATLGPQTTAVVTIVNDEPQTIIFTNSGGGVVTLKLQFAGTMSPSSLEPLTLALSGTDAGSVLTIKVKKSRAGTGSLQIDQITSDGGCRLIDARDFDVVGAGIELGGVLSQLKIHDLLGGVITANGAENQNTSITAHNLDDGSGIAIGSRLKSLRAARLGDFTTIDAPWIGTISLKGDKRNGIPGDCDGTITISGDGIATNQLALAQLSVSGAISNATIAIANGSIGSISAWQMIDSTVFVGYTPDDPSNPLASGTFLEGVHLRSLGIRSTVNGFVNSDVASTVIGTVSLSSVVTTNGGLTFGIAASDHITSVNVRTPKFKWLPAGADDQSLGDFHVIH